ncbi:MAG: nucleotidyltransferase family protein [Clostridia bacterium]|nr:nucleotidyltransferase family protein [Clostridia bacterium]
MPRETAIICEFNPLHNGHRAILQYAREKSDCVVAIMSGNFTQRSIPAVFDKYRRAEAALMAGADAVLELPMPWCSGSGEFFASGAVAIAAGLGVKSFVFGSETGDTDHVLRAASAADSPEYRALLESEDGSRLGTAVFHDKLMEKLGISLGSNDKLAAEYVRAAGRLGIDAEFTAYKRMEISGLYKSASDLREMLYAGEDASAYVPRDIYGGSSMTPHVKKGELDRILFNHFRLMDEGTEAVAFDAGGGALERLWRAAGEASCPEEFFEKAATKKYTTSRLRRAALYTFLGVTEAALREGPKFTVLLGATERGRAFLKETKKTRSIKLITKPSEFAPENEAEVLQYETWKRADELYSLCCVTGSRRGEYLRRGPHII